ncbi:MAG: anti-sigma factor domain-containing protein [Bacillota bacterium]
MKKVKGVVMRSQGNKTVIYSNAGDFVEIPTPKVKPLVGQIIEVEIKDRKPLFKHTLLKYASAAAVLILVIALGIFAPLTGSGTAVASISMDINHGIELLVDREARVIKSRDINKGTEYSLDGISLEGQDIYQAVELIIEDAGKKGLLGKDRNYVLLSVIPLDKNQLSVVDEEKLRSVVGSKMISKDMYGVVLVGKTDENAKRMAENMGMTVNEYMVYERCREDGLNVQAEAFKGDQLEKVLKDNNVTLPGLFPQQAVEVYPASQDTYNPDNWEEEPGEWHMPSNNTGKGEQHDAGYNWNNKPSPGAVTPPAIPDGEKEQGTGQQDVQQDHEGEQWKEGMPTNSGRWNSSWETEKDAESWR